MSDKLYIVFALVVLLLFGCTEYEYCANCRSFNRHNPIPVSDTTFCTEKHKLLTLDILDWIKANGQTDSVICTPPE